MGSNAPFGVHGIKSGSDGVGTVRPTPTCPLGQGGGPERGDAAERATKRAIRAASIQLQKEGLWRCPSFRVQSRKARRQTSDVTKQAWPDYSYSPYPFPLTFANSETASTRLLWAIHSMSPLSSSAVSRQIVFRRCGRTEVQDGGPSSSVRGDRSIVANIM